MHALLLSAVLLFSSSSPNAQTQTAFPWSRSYSESLQKSKDSGRPLMLYFTTDWCGWCKVMERETFVDPKVLQQSSRYIPVMLDAEKEGKELALRYDISAYPSFVFVKPDGTLMSHLNGYRNASDFHEGVAFILDGREEETRIDERLRKNPNDAVANCQKASLLLKQGDYKAAELHISKARQSEYRGTEMAKVLSDYGYILSRADVKKAVSLFEESLACEDEATATTTFNRYIETLLIAGDRAASLKLAKRMMASSIISPESRTKGANFVRYEEFRKEVRTPEMLVNVFVMQLQGVEAGKRDQFIFEGLFTRDAAVSYMALTQGQEDIQIMADPKTILATLSVDKLKAKYTEASREIRADQSLATVRLELKVDQTMNTGAVDQFAYIMHLHLLRSDDRWHIASLMLQRKAD